MIGRIEKAVSQLHGVTVARVGVITEKLHVCFDEDVLQQSEVESAVEALGYQLTVIRAVSIDPDTGEGSATGEGEASGTSHILLVTGMTCANCATKVDRTLTALPGVSSVSVDVTTNRVSFSDAFSGNCC